MQIIISKENRTCHTRVLFIKLPEFYLKCGFARPVKYTSVNEKEESAKSSFNSLVWTHFWNMKGNQSVPLWKRFKELASDPDVDKVNFGYLPPIPFHQPI